MTPTTLPFRSLTLRDAFGAEQRVVHIGLNAADDHHRRVLRDRANRRHSRYQGVIHAAADERGHGRRAAADENGFHFQAFGGKEAKILRRLLSGKVLLKVGVLAAKFTGLASTLEVQPEDMTARKSSNAIRIILMVSFLKAGDQFSASERALLPPTGQGKSSRLRRVSSFRAQPCRWQLIRQHPLS